MKMLNQISLFLILFTTNMIVAQTAQTPIVIQSGSTTKIAPTLDSAVNLAVNGDVLYLPGGTFSLTSALSKSLSFIGTGWRSDSSSVMGTTKISGTFNLEASSGGSYFSGIYFNTGINVKTRSNLPQYNLTIERCRINKFDGDCCGHAVLGQVTINESLLDYINVMGGTTVITNSIIETRLTGFASGNTTVSVKNSIFLHNEATYTVFENCNNLEVSNSIILLKSGLPTKVQSGITSLDMSNNLIVGEQARVNILGANNVRQDPSFLSNVFIQSSENTFSLGGNYRTKPACNCSDKGVYSGTGQFRSTPSVHITEKNVSTSTNNNFLKFQFKVKTDN